MRRLSIRWCRGISLHAAYVVLLREDKNKSLHAICEALLREDKQKSHCNMQTFDHSSI